MGYNRDIYPHFGDTKPEKILAGFLKQKDQDVCVLQTNVAQEETHINWGPMAFQNKIDPYGLDFFNQCFSYKCS